MSYVPLHHKYRPQTFAHLVGQEAIAQTLINAIRRERIVPAYLFTGPRGTGKTSSARILAKSLNCLKQNQPTESPCGVCEVCKSITSGYAVDVIEIDAASNTGVDNIREIIERAQFAPVQCRYKVYVVDECHMLSTAAFNALLKTLEEPPKHVVFVLATTDPQRVLPTIISRCQRFDFRRIPLAAMVEHLQDIAAKETINITSEALTLVAQVAQGGLRDAESLLDQLGLLSGQVTVEQVWDLVGAVPEQELMALTQAIASDQPQAVLDCCRQMLDRGREPLVVLQNLASFYRDLLIAHTAPNRNDLVAVTPPTWKQLCEFQGSVDISWILRGQQYLKSSEAQIKNSTCPRLWLEVTLLGLLPSAISASVVNQNSIQPSVVSKKDSQTPRAPSPSQVPRHSNLPPTSPIRDTLSNPQSASSTPVSNPQSSNEKASAASPTQPEKPETDAPKTTQSATPPNTASQTESTLEEFWQQVLAVLQPHATQALLRQHSHLISFAGSIAQIGFSSMPLLKLAQDKLPNIEAAFAAVYQSNVKVKLEQIKATKPSNTNVATEPPVQAVVTQSVTNNASNPKISQGQSLLTQEEKGSEDSVKGLQGESITLLGKKNPRSEVEDVLTETSTPVPITSFLEELSTLTTDFDAVKIDKALTNLKQFFEGEIVELTEDLSAHEFIINGSVASEDGVDDVTALVEEVEQEDESDEMELSQLPTFHRLQASGLDTIEDIQHQERLKDLELDENGDIAF